MSDDLAVYEKQGFGHRVGFGDKPALIIIDFINAFNDPDMFGGGGIQSAIDHTEDLLAVARHHELPIAYTSHGYAPDGSDDGIFNLKSPGLRKLVPGTHATAIVDQLAPRPGRARDPQVLPVRLLFHRPCELAGHEGRRYRDRHRLHHQRLRAGDGGRCDGFRVPADRPARVFGRSRRGAARGKPVRHGPEICRRDAACRRSWARWRR